MTPTAAMEVLLRVPPLHVMIEVEAQAGIYRIMCTWLCRPKSSNFGHTKQSCEMEHESILQYRTGQDASEIRIPQAIHSQGP
jgi:hypothetical protein